MYNEKWMEMIKAALAIKTINPLTLHNQGQIQLVARFVA